MNGLNQEFINNPIVFISQNTISSITWFNRAISAYAPVRHKDQIHKCNKDKKALFDLQFYKGQKNNLELALVSDKHSDKDDVIIEAHWCPYVSGTELSGYVDVLRINPQYKFVFTPAMNGCSLIVGDSPLGKNYMRIFHNQHPTNKKINDLIRKNTSDGNITDSFNFDEYGTIDAPNAFNFMFYSGSGWCFVGQPQILNVLTNEVSFRPCSTFVFRQVI